MNILASQLLLRKSVIHQLLLYDEVANVDAIDLVIIKCSGSLGEEF